jgi:large subunit ribosomal protein L17
MVANLASSLILNEYIVTTEAKAKACKSFVDKVIALGKNKNLYAKRRLERLLKDERASRKVLEVLADRYDDRKSGFVKSVRLGHRKGDNASLSKLILVGAEPFRKAKKVKTRKKKKMIETEKKDKGVRKKRSVLDRVKELRGRFASRDKQISTKGKGEATKGPMEGKVRSRSGI